MVQRVQAICPFTLFIISLVRTKDVVKYFSILIALTTDVIIFQSTTVLKNFIEILLRRKLSQYWYRFLMYLWSVAIVHNFFNFVKARTEFNAAESYKRWKLRKSVFSKTFEIPQLPNKCTYSWRFCGVYSLSSYRYSQGLFWPQFLLIFRLEIIVYKQKKKLCRFQLYLRKNTGV